MSESNKERANLKGRVFHAVARSSFARRSYDVCRKIPLVGHLAHASVDALLPHGSRAWARLPKGLGKGLWFYSDPRFELGYCNGDHEPWVQEMLQQHLVLGACFYDVGAHTGFFSLIAARVVGESGLVVAIEADPQNAQLLRANASRNHIVQVSVIQAAAWSSCGELTFQQASVASNRTEGHVVQGKTPTDNSIIITAVSLDDLLFKQHLRPPKFVKMDIEGGEWEALQGANRMLARLRPDILCEVHDSAMIAPIECFLRGFRYSTQHLQPVHPRYADYEQHYVWGTCENESIPD